MYKFLNYYFILQICILMSCSNKSGTKNMLAKAIKHNDLDTIGKLIDMGVNPNDRYMDTNAIETIRLIKNSSKYKNMIKNINKKGIRRVKQIKSIGIKEVSFFTFEDFKMISYVDDIETIKSFEKIELKVDSYVRGYNNQIFKLKKLEIQKEIVKNAPESSNIVDRLQKCCI